MLTPVIFAEWGGRAAGVDRVAEAMVSTLEGFPMPASPPDDGWFELDARTAVPDDREAWVDFVEQHRERDSQGSIEPLAGYSLSVARGAGARSPDDSLPFVSILAMVGAAVGGARIAANRIDVSASGGWFAGVPEAARVDLLRTVVEAWRPSYAVVVDTPLMLASPKVPGRTPWPGYASYFADTSVSDLVLPPDYAVSPFAEGSLAVLDGPWDAARGAEGIRTFLAESTFERIPEREPAEDGSTAPR